MLCVYSIFYECCINEPTLLSGAGFLKTKEYRRAAALEGTSAYARGHAGDNWLTSILRMRNCLGGSVLVTRSESLVTSAEWNIKLLKKKKNY